MAHPGGRPTKYKPEYCDMIIDYFSRPPQRVEYKRTYNPDGSIRSEEPIILGTQYPTYEGFAQTLGVDRKTVERWTDEHKEFCLAYTRAREIQLNILHINGLGGQYNSQYAQFVAKNCHGYKDKTDLSVEQSGPFEVKITVD